MQDSVSQRKNLSGNWWVSCQMFIWRPRLKGEGTIITLGITRRSLSRPENLGQARVQKQLGESVKTWTSCGAVEESYTACPCARSSSHWAFSSPSLPRSWLSHRENNLLNRHLRWMGNNTQGRTELQPWSRLSWMEAPLSCSQETPRDYPDLPECSRHPANSFP